MKHSAVLFLIAMIIAGCGPKKVVESTYENGNPKVVKYYEKVDGKRQVIKEVIYYENNVRKMEGDYENEARTGRWQVWYNDGNLWSTGEYKAGKRHGPGMVYHRNGKTYIESYYTEDEKTGKWRFFDTTGKVVKEVDFDLLNSKK